MVCHRQREIFGHTYLRKMMGIMWLSMQNGTWRWWEESLFLHWEGRQALIWILWCSSKIGHHLFAWTELLNTSSSTSQGTDAFRIGLITPDHPIPQIPIPCGGHLKEKNPQTVEVLKDNTRREIRQIPQETLNRVVDNFNVWVAAVIQWCGGWIKHINNYWKSVVTRWL